MDTDDLSRDTYDAVVIEAEKFHHDLMLQFGVLAGSCSEEEEYLNKVQVMINDWLLNWDIQEIIEEIFYERWPNEIEFKKCLSIIIDNICLVKNIPIEQRKFDVW